MLGLGGWFAGLVVAMFAFPALPLDDPLLAVVSIGVPVGLGIYLAWVDRSRTRGAIGCSVAVGGALAGALLGFQAGPASWPSSPRSSERRLARNLAVLALDIWGRPGAERAPARRSVVPAVEA